MTASDNDWFSPQFEYFHGGCRAGNRENVKH